MKIGFIWELNLGILDVLELVANDDECFFDLTCEIPFCDLGGFFQCLLRDLVLVVDHCLGERLRLDLSGFLDL